MKFWGFRSKKWLEIIRTLEVSEEVLGGLDLRYRVAAVVFGYKLVAVLLVEGYVGQMLVVVELKNLPIQIVEP